VSTQHVSGTNATIMSMFYPKFIRPNRSSNMLARQLSWENQLKAIDLRLCTYVPLGVTHRPNFGPVWFSVWPPGGQIQKGEFTPELIMAGSSPKFYHRYNTKTRKIHVIKPEFLIWPTFQGHRGQSSKHITKLACFVTTYMYLTLREQVGLFFYYLT
jgi:hypothetical protein